MRLRQIWTHYNHWLYFTVLAGIILGPLLLPGYILTLDLVWGPQSPHLFGLPAWVTEKLVLLIVFILAGTGAHRLLHRTSRGWPAYAAATFYVVNPFTYERFMGGQWLVLCGYALLPWVAASLLELIDKPGFKTSLRLTLWTSALTILSIHSVAMAALICLALMMASGVGNWTKLRRAAVWIGASLAMTLAFVGSYLVPIVLGRSEVAREINQFNLAQFQAFRTDDGLLGLPWNVLALQGFWRERSGQFALAPSVPGFWLAGVGLGALMILGLVIAVRRHQKIQIAVAMCGVLAALISLGVAWAPTSGLTQFLVDNVRLFRGYREPGKWVAVVALAETVLLAGGLAFIKQRVAKSWQTPAAMIAVALPLIATSLMLFGTAGQLKSVQYPNSWNELNTRLNALPTSVSGQPNIVILPWHQYLNLPFAGRTVAQPASSYFDREVIISGDPELPGVLPTGDRAQSIQTQVIDRRFFSHNAGTTLAQLGVTYVVLLKASDWSSYSWLTSGNDLTLITETNDWQLYKTGDAK